MTLGWKFERASGPAADLHAASAAALAGELVVPTVRILAADRPAVVLGSHQPGDWFDPASLQAAGLDLVRRASGGGAVLVGPGRTIWIDFVVPAGDRRWDGDIGRAAWWVGELWSDALASAGCTGVRIVWKQAMRRSPWSPVVCFAGLGPGEVLVDGAKVVGVSQRRTRRGALFQTAALLEWDAPTWASLLSPAGWAATGHDPGGSGSAITDLQAAARPLNRETVDAVVSAIEDRLTS